ncbi:peptidoglycan-binding protein [Rhodovulum sulfidophilum]|uniref:peptidoglycan-binding domain-containing protein n=1 Tax=Rhodovulum sulfidophilum TaxID=35806 RepID=UPI0019206A4D|nr:peptidoglycan-binding domain-containing protein [Rhodovulum sulfidophilum]MBL3564280.1 peptidoglycan-binding protein [Rhodovulum sulfidophilum]
MKARGFLIAATAVALTMPGPVRADTGDVVKLGIAAGAFFCMANPGRCGLGGNRNAQPSAAPQRTASPPPRQQPRAADPAIRTDQQALNYFGYEAGSADGIMGRRTRDAISRYQGYMGYPSTGRLDAYQRQTLVGAYNWAQAGGGSAYPGIYGEELLRAYASQMRGGNYCQETGRCPVRNSDTGQTPIPDLPQANASMANACTSSQMVTNANGPVLSPADITDPDRARQALNEQFCSASSYASSRSENLLAGSGTTDATLARNCRWVVERMEDQIVRLDSQSAVEVAAAADRRVREIGGDPRQISDAATICLGYGYRTDDPQMALASALMLVGSGARPYAELIGHHLRSGFGTQRDPARAQGWYDIAFDALDRGSEPAVRPSQSGERVAIMRTALGGQGPAGSGPETSSTGSGVPSFNLQ